MNPKIFVIDDFLETSLGYYDKINPANHLKISVSEIEKKYPDDIIFNKISEVLKSTITIVDNSTVNLKEDDKSPLCCHLESDYIGVLYLTLPLAAWGEVGVRFYSHKETCLNSFPTQEELKKFNISNIDKTFSQNLENWDEYGSIPIKHNRMVLFKSNLWHSYGNGFGSDLNTSMLYKKIIIKNG